MLAEYLLSYGKAGDFGRFRPVRSLSCRRGDRAVIRTPRGQEIGTVLCEARQGHALFLPNTSVGELLRLVSVEDQERFDRLDERAQRLFSDGRRLAEEMQLPVELLDVEILLDGEHAILHHLRWRECDVRPLVSALSRTHEVQIVLETASTPVSRDVDGVHGCDKPDCGKIAGGSCATCGTGGGCSTCGLASQNDVQAYFAGLREQMADHRRVPLA
jgi:cell fate regulator YaaT (PSP1 superfamily)